MPATCLAYLILFPTQKKQEKLQLCVFKYIHIQAEKREANDSELDSSKHSPNLICFQTVP
jgi:hypothetical protein